MTGFRKGVFAEALVIAFSILLAFTVDRAWDSHAARSQERSLVASLKSEAERTRETLDRRIKQSDAIAADARAILAAMSSGRETPARDSILGGLGSVLVYFFWSPVNDSYLEAMNSGRLSLLRDDSVRSSLARYQGALTAVAEGHKAIETQYFAEMEPFLVGHTVYSGLAHRDWKGSLVAYPQMTDFAALAKSRELWNLITLRLELEMAVRVFTVRADSAASKFIVEASNRN
jgi:hypothetical protein